MSRPAAPASGGDDGGATGGAAARFSSLLVACPILATGACTSPRDAVRWMEAAMATAVRAPLREAAPLVIIDRQGDLVSYEDGALNAAYADATTQGATRLAPAHGDGIKPVRIQHIATEPLAVGDTVLVRATITFSDRRSFTGISEVQSAESGAQASNPVECCETSAVGRALAMSGWFGSGEGLAGAEELRAATSRQNGRPASRGQRTR